MNIFLVSLFDSTPMDMSATGRYIGIANAANLRDHKILHYTSTFRHTSKKQRFHIDTVVKVNDDYVIKYLWSKAYKSNMMPKRFIAHDQFSKRLVVDLQQSKTKPDVIVVSMPPLSVAYRLIQWAKPLKIPVIIDIIDPWPDSFIKDVPKFLVPLAKLLAIPFYKKLEYLVSQANGVVAISNQYRNWALTFSKSQNQPSSFFYPAINMAQTKVEIAEAKKTNIDAEDRPIGFIYAGSLASSYDLPCILKAAEIINQKYPGKVLFFIAGTGPQEILVKSYESKLNNIKYLGWLNREQLMYWYTQSDIGLIQHKNSLTQTVTYKFFSYMSAGLALLNSLQSEMVDMIETHRLGLNNLEQDYDQLAANIEQYIKNPNLLDQHKQNALKFTKSQGDTIVVYDRMISFIESVVEQKQKNGL